MAEENIIYSYNDGETSDESFEEIIAYMIDEEVEPEYIVGTKLDVCKLSRCISDETLSEMGEILYNREEDSFDENDYLENKLTKIWESFKSLEMYYPTGETYTITEEDYNSVINGNKK